MSEHMKLVGTRVKESRKAKKLTQKELAAMIEKTESSVAKYERGLVEIPLNILAKIAQALDVSINHLLGWDPQDLRAAYEQGRLAADAGAVSGGSSPMNEEIIAQLVRAYRSLNDLGKEIMLERVTELTKIRDYT